MKNIILFLLSLFIVSNCASNKHLNNSIEDTIDNTVGCIGLIEDVRNNFFLNKFDSLYIENAGFFIHGLMNEYSSCIQNLSLDQIVDIFGIPHYRDERTLYYFIKKNKYIKNSIVYARTFQKDENGLVYVRQSGFDVSKHKLDFSSVLKTEKLNFSSSFEIDSFHLLNENPKVHKNCTERKKGLRREIFFHTEKDYFIVNTLFLHYLRDTGYPINCQDSFSKDEINKMLKVPPDYINEGKKYYALYNKPYSASLEINKKWNGMIYCLIFSPLDNDLHNCSFGMLDEKFLSKKRN